MGDGLHHECPLPSAPSSESLPSSLEMLITPMEILGQMLRALPAKMDALVAPHRVWLKSWLGN